jgi:Protein of unknown function (DUF2786)
MTPAPTPIIERLKKLIAMADRGTEHEAAIASERMQELLQEFNLTRADIESKGDEQVENALTAKREKLEHDRSAMYQYQRDLMQTIAGNNFCMYFLRTSTKPDPRGKLAIWSKEKEDYIAAKRVKSHLLIGRSENVQATILMYDYLIDTMHRLLPFQGRERLETPAKLWLAGCAETLCERLMKQRTGKEAKQETDGTPGLVRLADLYGDEEDLNRDFRLGQEPGTTARERREREIEKAAIEQKEKDLIAGGMDRDDAWHVARGEEVPKSREPAQVRKETPSERARREAAEERRDWREDARYRREAWKEMSKRNHPSFRQGRKQGSDIGLGGALGAGAKSIE